MGLRNPRNELVLAQVDGKCLTAMTPRAPRGRVRDHPPFGVWEQGRHKEALCVELAHRRPGPTFETTRAEAPPGKRGAIRPRPGSGLPGRVGRPLTNALIKNHERPEHPPRQSGRSKGRPQGSGLGAPASWRFPSSRPSTGPGPTRPSWRPPRHGGSSTSPSTGARTSLALWGCLSPRGRGDGPPDLTLMLSRRRCASSCSRWSSSWRRRRSWRTGG
jgi:hypothetical protein